MRRNDWQWLAARVAGLFLIVAAALAAPDWAAAMFDRTQDGTTLPRLMLPVVIPLVAGIFLLTTQNARIAPPGNEASDTAPAVEPRMQREDWLWVGLKLVGAWYLVLGLAQLVVWCELLWRWREELFGTMVGVGAYVALGIWLLFGSRVWRWACRTPRRADPVV